ncbi:hypothetical protein Avbf_13826, partial [Armadillidium vulgare]
NFFFFFLSELSANFKRASFYLASRVLETGVKLKRYEHSTVLKSVFMNPLMFIVYITASVVTDHLWQPKKFICCKLVDSSGRNKYISLAARLVRGFPEYARFLEHCIKVKLVNILISFFLH